MVQAGDFVLVIIGRELRVRIVRHDGYCDEPYVFVDMGHGRPLREEEEGIVWIRGTPLDLESPKAYALRVAAALTP